MGGLVLILAGIGKDCQHRHGQDHWSPSWSSLTNVNPFQVLCSIGIGTGWFHAKRFRPAKSISDRRATFIGSGAIARDQRSDIKTIGTATRKGTGWGSRHDNDEEEVKVWDPKLPSWPRCGLIDL